MLCYKDTGMPPLIPYRRYGSSAGRIRFGDEGPAVLVVCSIPKDRRHGRVAVLTAITEGMHAFLQLVDISVSSEQTIRGGGIT